MTKLKLLAANVSDLEVIASAVQDSIFQIGQTRFDRDGRSFTLRLSRYMHEAAKPNRIESGLRFDGVVSVSSQGVAMEKREAFVVVLGLEFLVDDSPAGQFYLNLAGGGTIRIAAEAIDVTLADRGDARPTKRIPKHDG
ncbi:MAG: DUF2948 family protein [Litorimonas sp.]